MHKVVIYSITERGAETQFYAKFPHLCLADDYANMWRGLAAKAGILIRIDREILP